MISEKNMKYYSKKADLVAQYRAGKLDAAQLFDSLVEVDRGFIRKYILACMKKFDCTFYIAQEFILDAHKEGMARAIVRLSDDYCNMRACGYLFTSAKHSLIDALNHKQPFMVNMNKKESMESLYGNEKFGYTDTGLGAYDLVQLLQKFVTLYYSDVKQGTTKYEILQNSMKAVLGYPSLTQNEMAAKFGCSRQNVQQVEKTILVALNNYAKQQES